MMSSKAAVLHLEQRDMSESLLNLLGGGQEAAQGEITRWHINTSAGRLSKA